MAKKSKSNRSVWRQHGKGRAWHSSYVWTEKGDRHVVLLAVMKNGRLLTKMAESMKMLKDAGWIKMD